jgi:CubicO group peptidase (beta-lactamase class C family)
MVSISRRQFGGLALALSTPARRLFAAKGISDVIRESMTRHGIPVVVAMVATPDKVTYSGAFGKRDAASGIDVKPDSIFRIASMTKAITTAAAMQLVEQGKVGLQDPVSKYLPELAKLNVIQGFDAANKPILKPATKQITLHHLLTHTSGFAYDTWDPTMFKYSTVVGPPTPAVAPLIPLIFEPGTRWQYGTSIDWAGKLVEKISGLTLEQYFQKNILQPLGMKDTSFLVAPEKFDRLVSTFRRQPDGKLKEDPRTPPPPPPAFNGGGGLFSTAPDYVKFTQMILHKGRGAGKDPILQPKTVEMMSTNQIGQLGAGRLKSSRPANSSEVDLHPGATDRWGYGFLINETAYQGGRSAGSLAWAGIENTFYWIDPARAMTAVIMMQFFPFVDKEAVGLLGEFEKAVYAA